MTERDTGRMQIDSLFSVRGKVVLVTGGSRGIGEMIAAGFLANGAKVYISSRKAEVCDATAQRLSETYGGECISLPANLAELDGIESLATAIEAREQRLDVLVNNAGVSWGAPLDEFPEAGWDKMMDTNVKGVFFLTQRLLPLLEAAGTADDPARVVNIGSIDGIRNAVFDTVRVRAVEGGAPLADEAARAPPRSAQRDRERDRARSVPDVDAEHRSRRWRRRREHRLGRRRVPQPARPRRHAGGHRRPGHLPQLARRRLRRRRSDRVRRRLAAAVSVHDHDWAQRWVRATESPRLLVVGGASLDLIHVRGVPTPTPGGAGLYTALAAARAGADVTMLAPLPDPMPPELAPALDRIRWVGPSVGLDGLPRFEIAYDDEGSVSLFHEHLGAEPDMSPDLLDLVDHLPACAYCVPFMDAALQRMFVDELRVRGCLVVAATYGKAARRQTELVRSTLDLADLSFCNADEAGVLYPDDASPEPGRFRFVTRGRAGVSVYQGDHHTELAGVDVDALDPTGAGDTFCGTTVARLLAGDHPVEAARRANAAAAEMVTAVGPSALWQPGPPPMPPVDVRARADDAAIGRVAALIAGLDELEPSPYTGELLPAVGDPGATAWFAAATLQQFGFWYERDGAWAGSMIATIDGTSRKGSDYLWAVYRRWAERDPDAMTPTVQASSTHDRWHSIAADDAGHDPFPDAGLCVALADAYGRTLDALGCTADRLVAAAATSARPMRALLTLLDHVGGYREDPLRKKSALLGVILRQRPEHLLPDAAGDDAPPIVDYHVQRSCLRTGMVTVDDGALHTRIVGRRVLDPAEEWAVRRATFDAVAALSARSGRDMGTVDWFLFQMRHRCPEATAPDCAACPADPACAHRIELFQPVLRTTAY